MTSLVDRLRACWPTHRSSVLAALGGSLTLGLAPFYPHAHVYKQLMNLAHGTLTEWIDVLDLLMHGAPWVLLFVTLARLLVAATKLVPHPDSSP